MTEKDSFEEQVANLQPLAAKKGKRIMLVDKGYSKNKAKGEKKNSSIGKQHKGVNKKRVAGEGVFRSEKKERMSISITPTARKNIEAIATRQGISASETIDRVFLGEIILK